MKTWGAVAKNTYASDAFLIFYSAGSGVRRDGTDVINVSLIKPFLKPLSLIWEALKWFYAPGKLG